MSDNIDKSVLNQPANLRVLVSEWTGLKNKCRTSICTVWWCQLVQLTFSRYRGHRIYAICDAYLVNFVAFNQSIVHSVLSDNIDGID